MVLGDKLPRVLVKSAVPVPLVVLLSAIVGVPVVFQQTPLAVIEHPDPAVIVCPPEFAPEVVIPEGTTVVVIDGLVVQDGTV